MQNVSYFFLQLHNFWYERPFWLFVPRRQKKNSHATGLIPRQRTPQNFLGHKTRKCDPHAAYITSHSGRFNSPYIQHQTNCPKKRAIVYYSLFKHKRFFVKYSLLTAEHGTPDKWTLYHSTSWTTFQPNICMEFRLRYRSHCISTRQPSNLRVCYEYSIVNTNYIYRCCRRVENRHTLHS